MEKFKLSEYNYTLPYKELMVCYNSVSDVFIILKKSEYLYLSPFLINLMRFKQEHPSLFNLFSRKNFIVDINLDEQNYISLNCLKTIFMDSTYKITINPTLDCNFNCWYCSVSTVGAKITGSCINKGLIN